MKLSIQLLILLLFMITGGLFATKYQLKQDFLAIDHTDPLYHFNHEDLPSFKHIRIIGGNSTHTFVKVGTQNRFSTYQDVSPGVFSHALQHDTLVLTFDSTQTIPYLTQENRWGSNSNASFIIECAQLESITTEQASAGLNLTHTANLNVNADRQSNLDITDSDGSLKALHISASDASKVRTNESTGNSALNELILKLTDNSKTTLNNLTTDSTQLELEQDCFFTGSGHFFQ